MGSFWLERGTASPPLPLLLSLSLSRGVGCITFGRTPSLLLPLLSLLSFSLDRSERFFSPESISAFCLGPTSLPPLPPLLLSLSLSPSTSLSPDSLSAFVRSSFQQTSSELLSLLFSLSLTSHLNLLRGVLLMESGKLVCVCVCVFVFVFACVCVCVCMYV